MDLVIKETKIALMNDSGDLLMEWDSEDEFLSFHSYEEIYLPKDGIRKLNIRGEFFNKVREFLDRIENAD